MEYRKQELIDTERQLAEDVAAYLANGGKVTEIPIGVSSREEVSGKTAFSLGGTTDMRPAHLIRD